MHQWILYLPTHNINSDLKRHLNDTFFIFSLSVTLNQHSILSSHFRTFVRLIKKLWMFRHRRKGVCWRVHVHVRLCTIVCACVPPLSISNEQPVNEGGPCSFHSTSQEIITLCLKPFSICTTLTASFSCHLYKNPILSLPLSSCAISWHLHNATYWETDKTTPLSTTVPCLL